MSTLFTACEADAGFRETGKPAWRKCGDVAACTVTVPDEDCRIALCQACCDWLAGVRDDLAVEPLEATA